MLKNDRMRQVALTNLAVENARRELCTLNELIEEKIRLLKLKGVSGEKEGTALKRALKMVDKAFDGFSGFPGIEVDLIEGGF